MAAALTRPPAASQVMWATSAVLLGATGMRAAWHAPLRRQLLVAGLLTAAGAATVMAARYARSSSEPALPGALGITDARALAAVRGRRFVVLVYNPSAEDADDLVLAFQALQAPAGIEFIPMSFAVVQQWEQLTDAQIGRRTVLIAVDVQTGAAADFPVEAPPDVASAVGRAVQYLQGGA